MPTEPEKHSTADPIASATYQAARGVRVGEQFTKPAITQQVRTVVTRAKKRSLGLRYAPHDPKVTDVSTSS